MSRQPEQEATLEQWMALFERAIVFRDAAPWEYLWDQDLFAVVEPNGGRVGYCSVTGRNGEHFSLGIYLGGRGYKGFCDVLDGDPDLSRMDYITKGLDLDYLTVSFEELAETSPWSIRKAKELGLEFAGPQMRPDFSRREPGWEPWIPDGQDICFLTQCLELSLPLIERFRHDPAVLHGPTRKGQVLTLYQDANATWQECWNKYEPPPEVHVSAPEEEIAQLQGRKKQRGLIVEVAHAILPGLVRESETERGFYPRSLLLTDHKTGMALTVESMGPDDYPINLATTLAKMLLSQPRLPFLVLVSDPLLFAIADTLLSPFKVTVELTEQLPASELVWDHLEQKMYGDR